MMFLKALWLRAGTIRALGQGIACVDGIRVFGIMATRPFLLLTTLRMVPNRLLREYLVRLGHVEFVTEWDDEKEKEIGPVFKYIQLLEDKERDDVESGLHSVSDLASEAGLAVLFQAAKDYGLPDLVNEAAEELGI